MVRASKKPQSIPFTINLVRQRSSKSDCVFSTFDLLDVRECAVEKNNVLYSEDARETALYVVEEGWLIAWAALQNGSRFIHRIYQRGDIIGLEDTYSNHSTSAVSAVTACQLFKILKDDYSEFWQNNNQLGNAINEMVMIDHLMMIDATRANARFNASARIAHLLLQIEARQYRYRQPRLGFFHCPLTQADIADSVGLSVVQTNKSINAMMGRGDLSRTSQSYRFEDRKDLVAQTGFVGRFAVRSDETNAHVNYKLA